MMYQTRSRKSVVQPPSANMSASMSGLSTPEAAAAPENSVPAKKVTTVANAST